MLFRSAKMDYTLRMERNKLNDEMKKNTEEGGTQPFRWGIRDNLLRRIDTSGKILSDETAASGGSGGSSK